MKLLDKWEDAYYVAKNHIYELSTGVKLVYTIKPGSKQFDMDIIFKGGAYFEDQLGVPYGTAHVFEHIFAGKPNKKLKTIEEIQDYLFGGRKRAGIGTNAHTNSNYIFFDVTCNENAAKRAIRWNKYRFEMTDEQLEEHLENERNVVLIERFNSKKDKKNEKLQFNKFINGDYYPEYTRNIIGTEKSIKNISLKDIKRYKDAIFCPENVVIAIQSGKKPSDEMIKEIEDLSKLFTKKTKKLKINENEMKINEFELGYFKEEMHEGVLLDFVCLEKNILKSEFESEDYDFVIKRNLAGRALGYLGHEELRDKKSMVYSFQTYLHRINWHWVTYGFWFKSSLKNVSELLEDTYNIVNEKLMKFLDSERGQRWLDSEVSTVLYPLNKDYDSNYSYTVGHKVLTGFPPYKYEYEKAKKRLIDISTDEVKKFTEDYLVSAVPKIWSVSDHKKSKVTKLIKKSSWVPES